MSVAEFPYIARARKEPIKPSEHKPNGEDTPPEPETVPMPPPDPEPRTEDNSGPDPPQEQENDDNGVAPPSREAATAAEIERLRDMTDAAFLLIDREAIASRLGCKPNKLDGLRTRAQTAKKAADKAIADKKEAAEKKKAKATRDAEKAADKKVKEAAKAAAAAKRAAPHVDPPDLTDLIGEFNAKYFVVNENGKTVIYSPTHDEQLKRDYFERFSFADFERFYLNRRVQVDEKNGEPVFAQAAPTWLRHTDRKQYGRMVFDPSGRNYPPAVLNQWRGFAVRPAPGSWDLLKQHIRTVICCNDTTIFNYVLDWIADLFQHPSKQGEVCIVLCGEEGIGKGVLARAIRDILGQHGLAISNSKHLVGNFNAHLRDCIFLFADEAFYAGDRAHLGVLKALVTEPTITIEGKYQNAVQSPNFLHIIMASNETWVVPASLRSRRWLVLDVDKSKRDNHDYFAAIQNQLDHGGRAAMLRELLNRAPLGNLRKVPVTAALQTQRKLSLSTIEKWWLDCLHRGYVFRSKLGLEEDFHKWLDPIATALLYDSYIEYCRANQERHPLSRELLGKWLRTMGCKPAHPTNVMVGEHITDATTTTANGSQFTSRVAQAVRQPRAWGYSVGTLEAARSAVTETTGLPIEWQEETDTTP